MKKLIPALCLVLSATLVLPQGVQAATESERTELQAAMRQHIDRQVVNGMYLHMNLSTGTVEAFSPAKAHPMMFEFGDHYVLCTDFKDKDGKATVVDFYVAKRGKNFAVFQTEINNRAPLMKLMEAGKVKSIDPAR